MAELTIQISDELAQRLEPLQNRLPELLWQLLSATISSMELAELDVYEQLEHLMILLKARALKRDE